MARHTHNVFTLADLPGMRFPWYTRMDEQLWRVMRQHIYARDGGKCCYCGSAVELFQCHIHHVLPLSELGTNHPTNLKTLCIPCHKRRHPHMQDTIVHWS